MFVYVNRDGLQMCPGSSEDLPKGNGNSQSWNRKLFTISAWTLPADRI